MLTNKQKEINRISKPKFNKQILALFKSINPHEGEVNLLTKELKNQIKFSMFLDHKRSRELELSNYFHITTWGLAEKQVLKFRSQKINEKKVGKVSISSLVEPRSKKVKRYNQIIVLQFKDIPEKDYDSVFLEAKYYNDTYFICRNAEGTGILIFVLVVTPAERHKELHKFIRSMYESRLGLTADTLGQNMNDLVTLSFDPYAYLNPMPVCFGVFNLMNKEPER
jgi:hypothetical protein